MPVEINILAKLMQIPLIYIVVQIFSIDWLIFIKIVYLHAKFVWFYDYKAVE
jgi:hypothetical protein